MGCPSDCPTRYEDLDGDGFGDPRAALTTCDLSAATVLNGQDCDDEAKEIHPEATELCNGLDDDCDGDIDENVQAAWFADADADGYGDDDNVWTTCAPPPALYRASRAGDCDDLNPLTHPGATERCDGQDNDCNQVVDDLKDPPLHLYPDADHDGYGAQSAAGIQSCPREGWVENNLDCDDNNLLIRPGVAESCDGQDNDCDGLIDDGVTTLYFQDIDLDGYGTGAATLQACSAAPGWSLRGDDCDDTRALVHPGGLEVCDQLDNDCDGLIDNVLPACQADTGPTGSTADTGA